MTFEIVNPESLGAPKGWSHGYRLQRHGLTGDERPFLETAQLSFRTARTAHSVPCVGSFHASGL